MRHVLGPVLLGILCLATPHSLHARNTGAANQLIRVIAPPRGATDNQRLVDHNSLLAAPAASDTTWLLSSNFNGSTCNPQGWTSVDITAQTGDFWHVDDYAGLSFGPIQGTKSLWCGARSGAGVNLCTYATLPGYGNSWDQKWCTKNCLAVSGGATSDLDVSFSLRYDTEASYDYTALEYTTDCSGDGGWTEIDGGLSGADPWNGTATLAVSNSYNVGAGPVKVRLRFVSDTSWSDQDGLYNSNGAAHVDNLKAETLATEDFEDETVGATSSNDWQSCNQSFGNFGGLLSGASVLQEDPCTQNVSCLWAFIQGSTDYYTCGGHPTQPVVPYGNERGFINNEIWSPQIALSGSGSELNLQFDVYRDNHQQDLVFYYWHVRGIVSGCPQLWKSNNLLYDSNDIGWFRQTQPIGSYVNMATATSVQVALGVIDMCGFWCGTLGSSNPCHTNGPMFDNVKVYRVSTPGPTWSVREMDLFQDTFSTDGSITGTARADVALDIKSPSAPTFTPGDSSIVLALMDPLYAGTGLNTSGLLDDPNISTFVGRNKTKKQAYMWVSVRPYGQPNKSGDGLSEGPGGQANRYPHIAAKDFVDGSGITWTAIRMDYTYTGIASNAGLGTGTQPRVDNRFNVDLNDNLFTPGDTVSFFFGATSPGGTTYYSDQWHVTNNIAEVASNPMEFTVLPAGGFNRGGDILYVDGDDGFGNQVYFDSAFKILRLDNKIDRYDVRAPESGMSNTLAGRVTNVAAQLNACYKGIIWDCGSLSTTLGDGTGDPIKCDDYALLNNWLSNATTSQFGPYLSGDDVAERLAASVSPSATTFKSVYIPFNLVSTDHVAAGFGVAPKIVHWPGRAYNDDFVAYGGCPDIHDFDVLNATGTSRVEMSYGTSQSPNAAVVSNQKTNGNDALVTVMLSGFSAASIRDDETNGISDRAQFIRDMIVITMDSLGQVTGAGPSLTTSLAQNYPNPFNPQTTISFTLAQRARVRLSIYDVNGALVRTLANEVQPGGAHQVTWDGRNETGQQVASGVYFYQLVTEGFSQTKKMVLLK
jgi:hypothetical protein